MPVPWSVARLLAEDSNDWGPYVEWLLNRLAVFALLGLLTLAGCADDLQNLKRVTVDDAFLFTEENHDSRRTSRSRLEQVIEAKFNAYMTAATVAWATKAGQEQAEMMWDKALALLGANYRDLATIEALRGGITDYGEFRRLIEETVPKNDPEVP